MNDIALIFPYYKNPNTLRHQISVWKRYPHDTEIIVVDDGSPVGLRAEEVLAGELPEFTRLKLFRIVVDLPWNMCGARNLGATEARSRWIALVDIDHVVSPESLEVMQIHPLDDFTAYSFGRVNHFTKAPGTPHKESRLMLRELFFNTGAFDETFCGHYAFPERDWLRRLESMRAAGAIQSGVLPVNLEHINDTQIMDSKTYGLVRKEGRDDAAWDDIIEWKKFVDHPQPIINRLPWKQIR